MFGNKKKRSTEKEVEDIIELVDIRYRMMKNDARKLVAHNYPMKSIVEILRNKYLGTKMWG